jgi:site-specific DNA-methyltransferase (adenine-specific)
MINTGMMSSKTAEWSTPQDFFDELDREFGFTLDPCCTKENRKCNYYFIEADDGLSQMVRTL